MNKEELWNTNTPIGTPPEVPPEDQTKVDHPALSEENVEVVTQPYSEVDIVNKDEEITELIERYETIEDDLDDILVQNAILSAKGRWMKLWVILLIATTIAFICMSLFSLSQSTELKHSKIELNELKGDSQQVTGEFEKLKGELDREKVGSKALREQLDQAFLTRDGAVEAKNHLEGQVKGLNDKIAQLDAKISEYDDVLVAKDKTIEELVKDNQKVREELEKRTVVDEEDAKKVDTDKDTTDRGGSRVLN